MVFFLTMLSGAVMTALLTFAYDYPTFLLAALGVGIAACGGDKPEAMHLAAEVGGEGAGVRVAEGRVALRRGVEDVANVAGPASALLLICKLEVRPRSLRECPWRWELAPARSCAARSAFR